MELSNKAFEDWITKLNPNEELVQIKDSAYCNELFGISFLIPKDWYVVSVNRFGRLFNDQILVGEYEHYKDEIFKFLDQPSLVVSKYDPNSEKYHGLVSPVIIFSIVPKEPDYKDFTLKQYASLIEQQGELGYNMLKKFQVTNRGEVFKHRGFDSIMYETEYLFEHTEIDEGIMVEMFVFNIDYVDFFLDFSMTECRTQNQIAKGEFNDALNTIRLTH